MKKKTSQIEYRWFKPFVRQFINFQTGKLMNKIIFYNEGTKKIEHVSLYNFLSEEGFAMMSIEGNALLVKIVNNIAEEVSEAELINCVQNYLEANNRLDVLEVFMRGVSTLLNTKKLTFLKSVNCFSDKHPKDKGIFYFRNAMVEVTKSDINIIPYTKSGQIIWKDKIIDHDIELLQDSEGQFKRFMSQLAKNCPKRKKTLASVMGYLLHRYNHPATTKAIILMDEKPRKSGEANGGTGKGILAEALGKCIKVATINGQETKMNSRFKNQRVDYSTDLIFYDDVKNNFSIDEIKSEITSGITVEKKGKNEFHISKNNAPKFLICTNYVVLGSGGSTDRRRRFEFEVANHYDDQYTPFDEFGNLLFEEWNEEEWNKFYLLMFECTQYYLRNGLIVCEPINLSKSKLSHYTSSEFSEFSLKHLTNDKWIDKVDLLIQFKNEFVIHADLSSHIFTKWLKQYAVVNKLDYEDKSSGGIQSFILKTRKEDEKEE